LGNPWAAALIADGSLSVAGRTLRLQMLLQLHLIAGLSAQYNFFIWAVALVVAWQSFL
jgi:hypothetical protein